MKEQQTNERVKGIYFDKTKNLWVVRFMFNSKETYLGTFITQEDAKTSLDLFYYQHKGEIVEKYSKPVERLAEAFEYFSRSGSDKTFLEIANDYINLNK
jgi:hypothetical protein